MPPFMLIKNALVAGKLYHFLLFDLCFDFVDEDRLLLQLCVLGGQAHRFVDAKTVKLAIFCNIHTTMVHQRDGSNREHSGLLLEQFGSRDSRLPFLLLLAVA